jgi:hypothetical protein
MICPEIFATVNHVLDNNPESLSVEEETIENLGPNGLGQLQAFLGYLKDKGWL